MNRFYLVYIKKLDAEADSHLEINKKAITISRMYK